MVSDRLVPTRSRAWRQAVEQGDEADEAWLTSELRSLSPVLRLAIRKPFPVPEYHIQVSSSPHPSWKSRFWTRRKKTTITSGIQWVGLRSTVRSRFAIPRTVLQSRGMMRNMADPFPDPDGG
jgi:hypothetical protein